MRLKRNKEKRKNSVQIIKQLYEIQQASEGSNIPTRFPSAPKDESKRQMSDLATRSNDSHAGKLHGLERGVNRHSGLIFERHCPEKTREPTSR